MLQFSSRKSPVIGIDISSTSIKIIELSNSGSGYRVEHYGVEPLPANSITEKVISDVDAVGDSIRKAVKKAGSKAKKCSLAVAGSAVISKVITMPSSLTDQDMEAQIQIEADQYIPYALEEVNLDFNVLGPTDGNPDTVDVLLAASRSENVEMRVAAAEVAGITPIVVDVEAYAIENIYPLLSEDIPQQDNDKTVGILDIGSTMTSLNVMQNGSMVYTREQPFGGKQLTEEIMHQYGLTFEEAGLAKKEGGLPDNYVTDLLEPFKKTAAQQANRFLQFFYSASQHSSVDHIVLAGGCASIPGLDEIIHKELGISVSIANPFKHISLGSKINPQSLGNDAPALLISSGLALRAFD
ncbi:MAG: pilus assembly protein PilM [Pseudomonadota bacterium]